MTYTATLVRTIPWALGLLLVTGCVGTGESESDDAVASSSTSVCCTTVVDG